MKCLIWYDICIFVIWMICTDPFSIMQSEGNQTQKAAPVILGKRPAQKGESKSEFSRSQRWGGRQHPCLAAESGGKFGSGKNILMGLCLWLYDWIHLLKLSKKKGCRWPRLEGEDPESSFRYTEFEGPIRWWSGVMCIGAGSLSSGRGYKYKYESHQKVVSTAMKFDEMT